MTLNGCLLKSSLNKYLLNSIATRFISNSQQQISDVTLSYELNDKHKSDRALIIAHGLFASKSTWKSLAKRLNDQTKYKVFTIDMRNHGSSYPYTDEMDYIVMARDLKKFVKEVVIGEHKSAKVALMGHSMGGKAAMAFALDNTENAKLIDKLIVADIAPTTSPSLINVKKYLNKMMSVDMSQLNGLKNIVEARKFVDAKLCELDLLKADIYQRQFLLTRLTEALEPHQKMIQSNNKFEWNFNLKTLNAAIDNIMEFPDFKSNQFSKRTLFIHGELSGYLTPKEMPGIERYFTNVKLVEVPKAGHVIHFDNPTFTINALNEYLNE